MSPTTGHEELVVGLRAEARFLGVPLLGVTDPAESEHLGFYRAWLAEGRHGTMEYLARDDAVARRGDLAATLAEVGSVIVVAEPYGGDDPTSARSESAYAEIARYAAGRDYHRVLKKKLLRLLAWLDDRIDGGVRGRAYTDTGPILERELARRAGLGWFGRNTMLINPRGGSYYFLGVLLVDVRLPADAPFEEDRCGTCRACLDACPTGALLGRDDTGAPVIDARRCISYLTIELRGSIPVELREAIGNRAFGCDICQEVCPWNRFASSAPDGPYAARPELTGRTLVDLAEELLALDDEGFRERFRGSPVKRARRGGLLRNVCVALGNWGDERAVAPLARATEDDDALVREHAGWALERIRAASG